MIQSEPKLSILGIINLMSPHIGDIGSASLKVSKMRLNGHSLFEYLDIFS